MPNLSRSGALRSPARVVVGNLQPVYLYGISFVSIPGFHCTNPLATNGNSRPVTRPKATKEIKRFFRILGFENLSRLIELLMTLTIRLLDCTCIPINIYSDVSFKTVAFQILDYP